MRGTSALALIKVALGLDVYAWIRCTTYVKHWSSVGASSKLLLCVSLHINASKTKVMSEFIPGDQRQAIILDGENLDDVEKLKCLGSMFVANGHGTEEVSSRINLARLSLVAA